MLPNQKKYTDIEKICGQMFGQIDIKKDAYSASPSFSGSGSGSLSNSVIPASVNVY